MNNNPYFRSIDPHSIRADAAPLGQSLSPPVCGRGRHLLRMAVRDGAVQVASLADHVAIEPAKLRGYLVQDGEPGRYVATPKGVGFLAGLTRVD